MKHTSLTCVPIRYGSLTIRMSPSCRFSGPYSTTAERTASVIVPMNSTSEFDSAGIEYSCSGGPEIVAAKSYQSRRITLNALFSRPGAHVLDDVAVAAAEHARP